MPIIGKVTICNMALNHIGVRSTIESLTEFSTEAKACNLWYDHSRIEALESYDWNFARRRRALVAHSDDPPDGVWGYRYQYPIDCIKARYIENPTVVHQSIVRGIPASLVEPDAIPYSVEMDDDGITKSILTDLDKATLIYTFDQQDTNVFSRVFISALSYIIAAHIGFSLTGKISLEDKMAQNARIIIQNAAANEHNENVARQPRDSEFIRARW